MMTLPFFAAFAAMVAAWTGRRGLAIALWALAVLCVLGLFRLHATSSLDILL